MEFVGFRMQVKKRMLMRAIAIVLCLSFGAMALPSEIKTPSMPRRHFNSFSSLVQDAFLINKNIFSLDSFKIITATFPLIAASVMFDKRLHSCFYDKKFHKNIHQLDACCHGFAKYGIVFPVFMGVNLAFSARDEDVRLTSQMFLVGLPFVMLAGDLIKAFKIGDDWCLRPWHERFSCVQRSHGGFPSGHMALAAYAAALYGMRFGVQFGVPLGAYAAFLGISFVNCNRHYLSQIVAGAGLGVIYAFAASRRVDDKLAWLHEKNIRMGLDVLENGAPAFNVSCSF